MSKRITNLATTAVVALFLLALCACNPLVVTQPATPGPSTYRVVILGDSISVDAKPYFTGSISNVFVDAVGGRGVDDNFLSITSPTYRQALPGAVAMVRSGGWLVIQDDGGAGDITPEFVQLVTDLLPDDVGLAWVSPSNVAVPTLDTMRSDVWSGIQAQPVHSYIDWYTVQKQPGMLRSDALHPTVAGAQTLNHLVWSVTG